MPNELSSRPAGRLPVVPGLALFCVAFLGLHVATAIADPYVRIGWAATVLPLASPYRTLAIGLGALAVDLGGTVLVTSLVRRRLGYRAWRAVHWLAYLAWPAAFAHAVTAGSELRIWWAALVPWGAPRRTRPRPARLGGPDAAGSGADAAIARARRPRQSRRAARSGPRAVPAEA